jgi:hypothetical protein
MGWSLTTDNYLLVIGCSGWAGLKIPLEVK